MKSTIFLILLIGGAGFAGWRHYAGNSAQEAVDRRGDKYPSAKVVRGDMHITLVSEGKIRAKESVKIFHTVEGMLTITNVVAEGTYVEQGQELVVFDNAKQLQDVETAEAELKSAETDIEIAQKAVEITERENAEALSTAQFKYNAAKLEYDKAEKGELPQTERKMRLEIEKAESELKQAKESFESITDKDVLSQGFITPAEIEKERIRYRSAQIQLEYNTSDLELFKTYTRPVLLNTKSADVQTTRANAATIESVNANKLRQKTAELEAKQEKLRQVKTRLNRAKDKLTGTTLKAPNAGMVLYGEQYDMMFYGGGRELNVRVGGQVYTNQTVITLPKMDELVVKTGIAEADINKIKEGLRVQVTSDAYPDLRETGTVLKTGNVAARNYFDATNHYDVTVQLRKGLKGIKPGVSTRLEIEIEDLKGVLKVPVSAVFTDDSKNIVYVKDENGKSREVKLGSGNDTHVAVLEGLKEGETVLLYEPENRVKNTPAAPAAPVAPAANDKEEANMTAKTEAP